LFQKRKLSPGTVAHHLSALHFFYVKTLKKAYSIAETPHPKRTHRLPTILSQEEVVQLIDAARTPYHHTLLMTLYASGVRNAELTVSVKGNTWLTPRVRCQRQKPVVIQGIYIESILRNGDLPSS
jgi:site-specific recombinase XerD